MNVNLFECGVDFSQKQSPFGACRVLTNIELTVPGRPVSFLCRCVVVNVFVLYYVLLSLFVCECCP